MKEDIIEMFLFFYHLDSLSPYDKVEKTLYICRFYLYHCDIFITGEGVAYPGMTHASVVTIAPSGTVKGTLFGNVAVT